MFKCAKCKKVSAPCEKATRITRDTRAKVYPERVFAKRIGRGLNTRWIRDPGGVGIEIVKEELRHDSCK